MSQKTPEASINPAIELLAGAKPSQREAAAAVGVSTSTIERALRDPANAERARADDASAATREVVRAMFEATLPDGTPDEKTRMQAATLRLKYDRAFEKLEEDEPFSDVLPRGCVLYPQPDYSLEDE
jgi:DNA-binding transcriptional MocR family regulator